MIRFLKTVAPKLRKIELLGYFKMPPGLTSDESGPNVTTLEEIFCSAMADILTALYFPALHAITIDFIDWNVLKGFVEASRNSGYAQTFIKNLKQLRTLSLINTRLHDREYDGEEEVYVGNSIPLPEDLLRVASNMNLEYLEVVSCEEQEEIYQTSLQMFVDKRSLGRLHLDSFQVKGGLNRLFSSLTGLKEVTLFNIQMYQDEDRWSAVFEGFMHRAKSLTHNFEDLGYVGHNINYFDMKNGESSCLLKGDIAILQWMVGFRSSDDEVEVAIKEVLCSICKSIRRRNELLGWHRFDGNRTE